MIPFPDKRYQIIYADPPWNFYNKIPQDGGRLPREICDYSTMTTEDICNLPVKNISDNNCILFIWITDAHLIDGLKVIKSWGFKYKTVGFVWEKHIKNGKLRRGVAPYTMKNYEFCYLAVRGAFTKYLLNRSINQKVEAVMGSHSEKPDIVRNKIVELCGNLSRIELFARQRIYGWDAWGDQVDLF